MNPTVHEAVAGEVRATLARQRRSARSVALQLGWKQGYLSRRITGETPFTINDLAAIAAALDVPLTSFFPGERVGQLRKQQIPAGLAAAA